MSSSIKQETAKINAAPTCHSFWMNLPSRRKVRVLQEIVMKLRGELETLNDAPNAIHRSLDFYTEVSRFEIEIIKQALRSANGHQGRAAQLLNLKKSTLNAMIGRYYIQLGPLVVADSQSNGI